MPTALIVGASRGIGRELVRQYLDDGWRTLATARNDDDLADLRAMGAEPHRLDVKHANDWAALGWSLDGEKLDVVFHAAGVLGGRGQGLDAPAQDVFDDVMRTNVLAPMRMIGALAPALIGARGRLAVLSSRMGSIGERDSAASWLYRASKAAANSVLKDIALTYPADRFTAVVLHPGWVRTDMGGANAALSVEDSVSAMRATVAALQPSQHGGFFNYDGAPIPW